MTTIIIVVVVALVFFVALCVVTFMVWKREEEMRTDSLRSIEVNLQELGYRMSGDFSRAHSRRRLQYNDDYDSVPYREGRVAKAKSQDPFEWTREDVAFAGAPAVMGAAGVDDESAKHGAVQHVAQTELEAYEDVYASNGGNEHVHPSVDAAYAKDDGVQNHQNLESEDAKASERQEESVEVAADDVGEHAEAQADLRSVSREESIYLDSLEELDDFKAFEEYAEQLDMEALRNSLAEGNVQDKPQGTLDSEVDSEEMGKSPDDSEKTTYSEDDADEPLSVAKEGKNDGGDIGTDEYVADYIPEDLSAPREHISHDTGRSGKRYTAEELDLLIRE